MITHRFLQLLYEFAQVAGEAGTKETIQKNWAKLCGKLHEVEVNGVPSLADDLAALEKITKGIHHKPPANKAIEVTPVSSAKNAYVVIVVA